MNEITDIGYLLNSLLQEVRELRRRVETLEHENGELRDRLSRYEHPKDSHNSNLPPSKDPIGKKVNLRTHSGRPSGGQKGHKGTTLEMQTPHTTVPLSAHYCTSCGRDLSFETGEIIERRQQIDLPPIVPEITEYHKIRKVCRCNHVNDGEFPTGVNTTISYGSQVQSLVTYLSVCQHIPSKRLVTLMKEVYGLSLSEGTIYNILSRMEKRSYPAYEAIRERLSRSPVVGVDETGCSVNGKTRWAWVWQNKELTYITAGHSRKKEVFEQVMPHGMPDSVLVTDCYSSYFSQKVKAHQLCTAHLLRELIYLSELYDKHPWCESLAGLIREALKKRKETLGKIDASSIKARLQSLLDQVIEKGYEKMNALQNRLIKYRDYLFYFLDDENVPPDNNASERAIRVFKIKLKVSGFFKSDKGAQCFAQLHSITDTARKNRQSPVGLLYLIASMK